MKEDEIKNLLERYWQCETSPEEERELRALFSDENLSEELKIYQPLFLGTRQLSEIKADKELKSKLNPSRKIQFYPALKIAASILVVVTIGIGAYTHYQQGKQINKSYSDTYTDPEEAVQKTEQVIAKVSSVLQMIQEDNIQKELLDSLQVKEVEIPENE
jgi:hypothetical protein